MLQDSKLVFYYIINVNNSCFSLKKMKEFSITKKKV
jgi:hypothetical protein